VAGNGGGVARLVRSRRKGMICGAHLSAKRGEGQRRPKAGALSCDGGGDEAGHHRLTGLLGRWREAAARERVGQRGRSGPVGPKSKECFITYLVFLKFQWISNFGKTLEISTRRFRMNFDMGIFLNSSRLFKDFRKTRYVMPCNASCARLFLKGFSYARQIDMQPICTSILPTFYSWKMWVLQT
jgi:hypothetical protein